MKRQGFTLVEFIVVIAIISIIVTIVFSNNKSNISNGYNGYIEVRCIEGFKYTVNEYGQEQQMLDENGFPIICSN